MAESTKVPDWWVERLAANDLDRATSERVRSRLAARDELGRLQAIDASNRAVLAAHPTGTVVAEIERRLHSARAKHRAATSAPSLWRWAWPGLAAGCSLVAALLLLLEVRHDAPHAIQSGPVADARNAGVTAKGLAPQLLIYRQREGGAERLGTNSRVQAGDVLQVAYVGAGRRYGVIASVDALGVVSLHLPEMPGIAAALKAGETPVPHAFELDDSPGFERFVFASSETPFGTAMLVEALRSGKIEGLSPSLELKVVVLEKGPAR